MVWIIVLMIIGIIIFYNKKGIPCILYHHIGKNGVSVDWFEEHLKIIKKLKMKTITNNDVQNKMNKSGKLDKNTVLLTFDDGYYDNYKYANPLLKKYGMKATLYLNTAYIESENNRKYIYLSWKEIKEMSDSGIWDIQLHSHRHMPIFTSEVLDGILEKSNIDDKEIQYLYNGNAKLGYPIFKKRGEYSSKGIIVNIDMAEKFKQYYDKLDVKYMDGEKKYQKYIDEELKDFFKYESDVQFENRILEDLNINRDEIKKHCGIVPTFFCWPWGHKNQNVLKLLKNNGIYGFVTTRKGTNSLKMNVENIKRIELREFTPFKFKLNILIARNYFLGKVYQLLS